MMSKMRLQLIGTNLKKCNWQLLQFFSIVLKTYNKDVGLEEAIHLKSQ